MSQAFYEKFLSFFLGFVLLFILIMVSSEFLLYYFSTWNLTFYYSYLSSLCLALLYAIKYFIDFKSFKENLNLFLPSGENSQPEPLNIDVEETALKVCLFYRNGVRLKEIEQNLGLKHSQQVKRLLLEGLTILLKEHAEKEQN